MPVSEEESMRHITALSKAVRPMLNMIKLKENQIADMHLAVSWNGAAVTFHAIELKPRP